MSTNRTFTLEPESKLPRGPNGRKLCRQCSTETKPPARTFCSQACVDAWKTARPSPSQARARVFERDRGVCALCRRDTEVDRRELSNPYGGKHLWEADHIVPVVEGGGECGIDNYRTLCLACHRAETAALAARRAEKRRLEKGTA